MRVLQYRCFVACCYFRELLAAWLRWFALFGCSWMQQHSFIRNSQLPFWGEFMHHYKKYLAVACFGLLMTAAGLTMAARACKKEKRCWCH